MTDREMIQTVLGNLSDEQLEGLKDAASRFKRLPFRHLTELVFAQEAHRRGEISDVELCEQEQLALARNQDGKEFEFLVWCEQETLKRCPTL